MSRTKKSKSDILSSMGVGFEIVKAIRDEVDRLGGGDDELRRILSDHSIAPKIAALLVGRETNSGNFTKVGSVYINLGTESIPELITAGGYDYISPNIEPNFQRQRAAESGEIVYGKLPHAATTDQVEAAITQAGLQPATCGSHVGRRGTTPRSPARTHHRLLGRGVG
jgi:hypothetical protein